MGPFDRRLVPYLPAIILVLVALNQFRLAHTTDISPWKGGGFGMFSTIERPDVRHLRCYVIGQGQELALEIPPQFQVLANHVRNLPTEENLLWLAGEIARAAESRLPGFRAVRLEVWRRELDFATGGIRVSKWREAVYEVSGGAG